MSSSVGARLWQSIGLAGLAALLCVGASAAEPRCTNNTTTAFNWAICEQGSVWIIETQQPLAAFYVSQDVPTLRQKSASWGQAAVVINGAYHDGNYAQPTMEGLFAIAGREISPIKPGDRQLTHVMTIGEGGKILGIMPALALPADYPDKRYTYTQSGPLILEQGEPALDWMANSLNGPGAYKRTAIGVTAAGETVIVIARTPYTLPDLARIVLEADNYRERRLTLLNFDGGPSTAIHASDPGGPSYGADKVTPVGFGILR